ncbi:MAG: hypothetical protein ACRD4Q_07115 [Candidatus Acidiferrales bacterium]
MGELRRPEILPILIDALNEDFSRSAAEDALRKLGVRAGPALCETALRQTLSADYESPSSVRRRRSALGLLGEMKLAPSFWERLAPLVFDPHATIAAIASGIALSFGPVTQKHSAVEQLVALLATADSFLCREIEGCLVEHFAVAKATIEEALSAMPDQPQDFNRRRDCVLARVLARAHG